MERPPPPGGGGRNPRGRKPKNKRSRRNNKGDRPGGGGNASKRKGPPSPPQTKLVVRNIGDVDKHGSVAKILEMIRLMIDSVNQKFAAQHRAVVQLEQASIDVLLEEEEAVRKAAELVKAQKESAAAAALEETKEEAEEETNEDAAAEGPDNKDADDDSKDTNDDNNKEDETKLDATTNPQMEWAKAAALPSSDASIVSATSLMAASTLEVRVVYVVPPKKTLRRGEKPGCAYLVLSAPRIEPKEPPVAEGSDDKEAIKTEKVETKVDADAPPLTSEETTTEPQSAAESAPVKHTVVVKEPEPTPMLDYSREIARGRLLLLQAIDVLSEHAKENAKADQTYAGSLVEVAMSGKTYRHQNYRRDRREGTLETTADYKNFMAKVAQEKEDRLARPKPAPGGGTMSVGATDANPSGQPVAALVEHIRKKRAEASKRKKAKKKAKDAATTRDNGNSNTGGNKSRKKKGKEGNKNSEDGGGNEKGGGRNAKNKNAEGKRGKRGTTKKKKGGKGADNASGAAPTLLKPGGSTPVVAQKPSVPTPSLPGINGGMGGFQGFG